MRKSLRTTLFSAMLLATVQAFASTATDFYMDLLQRGTSEVDAGRYDTSLTPLRLAAFGLVDSIEHYETAQVYLTVALDKLGKQEEARRAAQRVVAAEAIERKFATLALPEPIRTAFGASVRKLLSSAEAAAINAPPQSSAAPNRNRAAIVPPVSSPAPTRTVTPPAPAPVTTAAQPQKPAPSTQRNDPPQVAENPKPAQVQTPIRNDPPRTAAPAPAQNGGSQKPQVATAPKPAPPATSAASTTPKTPAVTPPKPTTTPAAPKPQTAQPVLQPQSQTVPPQTARVDVPARLAAADRALNAANLVEGRRIYRELLTAPSLERNTIIRIGEGLYRARDFGGALLALRRLGTLKAGEEAYRYYIAVALFETGDVPAARRELASALPFIEITPDVQRYREKIEGVRN